MAAPRTVRYNFWAINDARAAAGSGKGAVDGLGAHPSLRHRGGGPRAAGAERISGHRKPHSEGAVERAAEALRRRASHAWRDRSSLGPQTPCRGRNVAKPDTILAWYRKLVARKFDGSKGRRGLGRPRIKREFEQLIVRMASENRDWGYGRIVGALTNLGYEISAQTVGNVLRRHALPPAPESAQPHGRPLFGPTSRCWERATSSRRGC